MLIDFFKKRTTPVDTEYRFRSIVHLVEKHNLPIERMELVALGHEEGLPSQFIEKVIDELEVCTPEVENENFRKWCLEKIVRTLINKVGRIDEDLYKILVNLVNGLFLKFIFLDSIIRKIRNEKIKIE